MTVMNLRDLDGKRAVVIGGGKTGAAAARLLLQRGAHVEVVDDAPLDKVVAGLEKNGLALDRDRVDVHAGGISSSLVAQADLAVLSPGVPRAHKALREALGKGVPVVNEVELAFAALPDGGKGTAIVGITGTNGKSTTTTMAGSIAAQFDPQAFVGGNLGTPWCQAVVEGKVPRVAVIELSSYQLETIQHLPLRAAVVTNLSPDHLDRYPNAEAYYAAKARIFSLIASGGGTALNAADATSMAHLTAARAQAGKRARCDFDVSGDMDGVHVAADKLTVQLGGAEPLTEVLLRNERIVGHHNRQNAAAAVAAMALCGVPASAWQKGLDAYGGIAHRLERVGARGGVTWLNDSKGTNVDATVTAVKSFAGGVHLIAGGVGKGSSYAPLVDASRGKVKRVYTIGQDAPAIASAYRAAGFDVVDSGTLEAACRSAQASAVAGDVILLSPACASFDQFKDYAHRGDSFRALFSEVT
jgi:UDP-N-acetylmuramoylalanine--D-glutamate ligase